MTSINEARSVEDYISALYPSSPFSPGLLVERIRRVFSVRLDLEEVGELIDDLEERGLLRRCDRNTNSYKRCGDWRGVAR